MIIPASVQRWSVSLRFFVILIYVLQPNIRFSCSDPVVPLSINYKAPFRIFENFWLLFGWEICILKIKIM